MIFPQSIEAFVTRKLKFEQYINNDEYVYAYLHEIGRLESPAVRRFLDFMHEMNAHFSMIYRGLSLSRNVVAKNYNDDGVVATSREEMLQIAFAYYCLMDMGGTGDILECGCFKGASSCCLSHVANYFGHKLIVADSFAGLPDTEDDFYIPGQFCGEFNEVVENIERYGCLESVDFIRGFYDDSLKSFSRRIGLLWMDVDLYKSALSVLDNVWQCLDPRGVIFSHEISKDYVKNNLFVETECHLPKAFNLFFKNKEIDYFASHVYGCIGMVSFKNSIISAKDFSSTNVMRFVEPKPHPLPDHEILRLRGGGWCRYCIDRVEVTDGLLQVEGWAVDGDTKLPILEVFLEVNGIMIAKCERMLRPDIKVLWDDCLDAGFKIQCFFVNSEENRERVKNGSVIHFVAVDGKRVASHMLNAK